MPEWVSPEDTMNNIPVVILCGGSGTRLREQTEFLPKPMIPIGGKPMLVHIMKWYAKFGFCRFILALGYKQEVIKNYFLHYDDLNNDVTICIGNYRGKFYRETSDDWEITMVDTGENTLKGGRLKRVEKYINCDTFMCSYGDGIGNVDIGKLLAFHNSHGKIATVTGVIHPPRFGEIVHDGGLVKSFSEKKVDDGCLINGGFFVFDKKVLHYINDDHDLETFALPRIANQGNLMVYQHNDYWGCMDTMSDLGKLQNIWESGKAPWRVE
jgi:glucose-1-phosphate cytidylyltransferase